MTGGRVRVLYVGGMGRSGSTLIERVIGQLPGACPVGELVHLWERGIAEGERCGCGLPFRHCPFWQQVGKVAFGGWDQVDVGRVAALRARVDRNRFIPSLAGRRVHPRLRTVLDEYTAYYARLYAAITEVTGCDLIIDSSKHPSLAHCLRWRTDIDLCVLHLVRDSRAVAYSWSRQVRRPDAERRELHDEVFPGRGRGPVERAERRLPPAESARLSHHADALRGLHLRSRKRAMHRLADFARLPAQTAYPFLGADGASCWARLDGTHSVSGNPMRFTTGQVPISRDERWRTAMPRAQRHAVTVLTFPLLAGYGYLGARP